MTYVLVDVHYRTHTCPATAEPHPYDTIRTIVGIVPGAPCRQPVTIRCGTTSATIACGRHARRGEQCPACRVVVTERHVTTEHMGHHGPQHPTTDGVAA